ncbi:hypothetical protein GS597_09165 [Synechococcales cyanobacterium C]|uniref:Uncharacterized protein n=1 Tax=Petrachloros mirabilis ULC683 TaxID=2781853 RepID=A0A8K1ZYV4_9CYAN|nr:hypothetical protein [Petrachloros mirabilis]NCJ06672.1 hypothetical protein [Petrachloros mirabilis ULC683]
MSIERQIKSAEAAIERLKAEGAIPRPDFSVDSCTSTSGRRHYRKRWWNGAKRECARLGLEEYRELRALLDRGKQVRVLERHLEALHRLRRSGV